jgi:hypothetical protein
MATLQVKMAALLLKMAELPTKMTVDQDGDSSGQEDQDFDLLPPTTNWINNSISLVKK